MMTDYDRMEEAIRCGSPEKVQELCRNGHLAEYIAAEYDGQAAPTLLLTAAKADAPEIVKLLITHGAQADQAVTPDVCGVISVDDGYTPLMAACYNGSTECALLLIEAGADVNKVHYGTPLTMAVSTGGDNLGLVQLLLECVPKTRTVSDLNSDMHASVAHILGRWDPNSGPHLFARARARARARVGWG